MTPEQIEKRKAELKAELERLEKLADDPVRRAFRAHDGITKYNYISSDNDVFSTSFNVNSSTDYNHFECGNLYATTEHAAAVAQNRKVHQFLKCLADFEPDWEDEDQCKYSLSRWRWEQVYSKTRNTVYFREPIEDIHDIVDARFGEGALMQYLTGDLV